MLLQHFLLTIDILVNAFGDLASSSVIGLLTAYAVQDMSQILSLIVLFLLFFRTHILQANIVCTLMKNHWLTFTVLIWYIMVTVTLQILMVDRVTSSTEKHHHQQHENISSTALSDSQQKTTSASWMSSNVIVTIFIVHRITSAVHYYLYRSAAFKLHHLDPQALRARNEVT